MVRLVADLDNSKKVAVSEGVVGRYRPTQNQASWRVTAAKAMATTRVIFEMTCDYCRDRTAFGKPA